MTEDTKYMLLKIRTFLRRDDEASRDLWDVLTTLRGPDAGKSALKHATTGVIRTRLLGLGAGSREGNQRELNGAIFGPDDVDHAKLRASLGRTHFTVHAQKAFQVLGLNWHKVNRP